MNTDIELTLEGCVHRVALCIRFMKGIRLAPLTLILHGVAVENNLREWTGTGE